MTQKILQLITSTSERSRKIIAGITVGIAGIMLFFAWTAGVSTRLPLLGSEFQLPARTEPDSRLSLESSGGQATTLTSGEQSRAAAVSPVKGLFDSFQDLVQLFSKEYPAIPDSSSAASSSQPINELFNKISDEIPAATSTDNLPLIEELPGL